MGTFSYHIEVGDFQGAHFEPLEALVETGATYTSVPRDVLERLGVEPEEQRSFILADGQRVTLALAWARIRLDGRQQPSLVLFAEPGTRALLGALTLEGFGLAVDPVNKRLQPAEAYLVGLLAPGPN